MMAAIIATLSGAAVVSGPITASADWGSDSVLNPSVITSATRTLTVPAGNPGSLLLNVSGSTGITAYSKNGGGFTNFGDGSTITVANGDTLAFKDTPLGGAGSDAVTVTDNTLATPVGGWTANST